MVRLLIIGSLLFALIYLVFSSVKSRIKVIIGNPESWYSGFQYLAIDYPKVKSSLTSAFVSALFGLTMGLAILFLATRLAVLLLLLPISIYLLLQLAVVLSHIHYIQNAQFWYSTKTGDIIYKLKKDRPIKFNLFRDVTHVNKVESIQSTRGLEVYFYHVQLSGRSVRLSFLHKNKSSEILFRTLHDNFNITTVKKLTCFI